MKITLSEVVSPSEAAWRVLMAGVLGGPSASLTGQDVPNPAVLGKRLAEQLKEFNASRAGTPVYYGFSARIRNKIVEADKAASYSSGTGSKKWVEFTSTEGERRVGVWDYIYWSNVQSTLGVY